MNARLLRLFLPLLLLLLAAGCANIVPPSGGVKDVTPPKLLSVTPKDSSLGQRVTRVRFDFNEYVTLTEASTQVIISPLLAVPPTVTALSRHITITVPDSLLEANTTYRITLGTAVRDLNEGNIYKGAGYIFSTGAYFDSLSLSGRVMDAATGQPDTGATVLLYNAANGDSAIVRKRPLYATHVDAGGRFALEGLPARRFSIYALRDKNANLIFDDRSEWIAFNDTIVLPGHDSSANLVLRTFPAAGGDTAAKSVAANGAGRAPALEQGYTVAVDTADTKRRSQDIGKPLKIVFATPFGTIDQEKFFLAYDSAGITTEVPVLVQPDSSRRGVSLSVRWQENTLYTLRLQKGFAKDSAGKDFLPGRYPFRTKRDDDYAKLLIHLPSKYYGAGYVLQVTNGADTVYRQPVLDTNVALTRLAPGTYKLLVIEDKNRNGRWDTGDLFGRKQPELVLPDNRPIMLKPGWENQQDFEAGAGDPPAGGSRSGNLLSPEKSSRQEDKFNQR